ncbi:MAG: hypothetical protein MJZ21_01890 [archaeon]|nr:hypothetical protein [archaeon]
MGLASLFARKKKTFPSDREGRMNVIMEVHRRVSGDDVIAKEGALEELLDIIDGETDPFQMNATVIYHIGYYKPFASGNEETAKTIADGILADKGLRIIDNQHSIDLFYKGCAGEFSIDSIVEWQLGHYEKI